MEQAENAVASPLGFNLDLMHSVSILHMLAGMHGAALLNQQGRRL